MTTNAEAGTPAESSSDPDVSPPAPRPSEPPWLLRPRTARLLGLAGAAILVGAAFLPAMHRLGGGSFSTIAFLREVQSASKELYFYPQLVALPALLGAFVLPGRAALLGLALLGFLGVLLNLGTFSALADTPRTVATWTTFGLVLAAAALFRVGTGDTSPRSRLLGAGGLCLAALGLFWPQRGVEHQFALEVASFARRSGLTNEALSPFALAWRAVPEGGGTALVALGTLLGAALLPVGLAGVLLGERRPRRARATATLLLVYLASLGPLYAVASAWPGSRLSWDLGVRARYALTAGVYLAWFVLGLAGAGLPTAPSRPSAPPRAKLLDDGPWT